MMCSLSISSNSSCLLPGHHLKRAFLSMCMLTLPTPTYMYMYLAHLRFKFLAIEFCNRCMHLETGVYSVIMHMCPFNLVDELSLSFIEDARICYNSDHSDCECHCNRYMYTCRYIYCTADIFHWTNFFS